MGCNDQDHDWQFPLTSTSHKALLLVAAVADVLPVVRKNTCCFFSYSSIVRNFSCSAWNKRITSPPLRILSSTFSLCSMNKVIFHEAFELSTLTWKFEIQIIIEISIGLCIRTNNGCTMYIATRMTRLYNFIFYKLNKNLVRWLPKTRNFELIYRVSMTSVPMW